MNIFDARKLQKELYNNSNCELKIIRTQMNGDKLCYTVSHHISDNGRFIFPESVINRLFSYKGKIETHFIYNGDEALKVPKGMYALEIINIDD